MRENFPAAKPCTIFASMTKHIIIIMLLSACAQADVIRLKNGREIEGIIQKETASEVTIKVGPGLVTLKRSAVASLEKGGAGELETKWRAEHFLHPKYIPAGLEDTARDFQNLQTRHGEALAARAALDRIPGRHRELSDELTRTEAAFRETRAQMNATDPKRHNKLYNDLVTRHNTLNNRVLDIQDQMETLAPARLEHAKTIGAFLGALTQFKLKMHKTHKPDYPEGSPEQIFFAQLRRALLPLEKDVEFSRIPYDEENRHAVMTAAINGHTEGRFLLDTGATFVSLSSSMADRLGLNLSGPHETTVTLADGSRVTAKPVMLDSMQVGDARVEQVPAMVLPNSPAPGMDGLLGMSFLQEFSIHFDAANHRLILQRFRPE